MTALQERKKSFLSDPAWKKLPWSHMQKTPKDILLDILVDVPTLFEAIDIASHCKDPNQKADYQERLYMEYVFLEKRLTHWAREFASVLITHENNALAQDVIMPQILAAAHVSTLYWVTCIIVYGFVGKVLMAGYGEEPFKGIYVDPGIFCQDILRIIPLFLHFSTGIFRVHLATPPLSVVMIYLGSLPSGEMEKEKAMLAGYLRDPSCSSMRKFIASMNPEESTKLCQHAAS
jgi:hypothetical protein